MKSVCVSFLVAAVVLVSGCATIVNGTTQRVEIASEPSGANAKVDGIPIGTTPTSIDLKRGETHSVTIEKDGYVIAQESIAQKTSWWTAGNLVVGSVVGFWVDYSNGAMYNLTPDAVSPVLVASTPQQTASPVAASAPPSANSPMSENSKGAPKEAPSAKRM